MHKNTLYITFDGLSDPLGQSQILPYLRGIAAQGFHIHILSCEKEARLEQQKATILASVSDLPITWDYILYDPKAGTFSRFFYVQKIKKMATALCREKKMALVHCRSYLAALIGLRLKHSFGILFVFDMRGFWADERLDGGIWKKSDLLQHFFYRYFKRKEKQFVLQADAIVSLTHAAVPELNRLYPEAAINSKVTVIPCCTDLELFHRRSQSLPALAAQISEQDHLLIYTGSIGTWYYTQEMIACCMAWKELIPHLKLLILTKDLEELEAVLSKYDASQRSFILAASSSHQEVASYLALAKAAIFFIKPAYSKMASSPTKMAECWAMELPIITNPGIGDNDLYFKQNKGGVLVHSFDREAYLAACKEYLALKNSSDSYREIAVKDFNTEMAREKYSSIYKRLSDGAKKS